MTVGYGDSTAARLPISPDDKKTKDVITRHAKPNVGKSPGLGTIPPDLARRRHLSASDKATIEYKLTAESLVFFKNLLALESVFKPAVVSSILKREHYGDPRTFRRLLANTRGDLQARLQVYAGWLAHFTELGERLLKPDVDLTSEPLLPAGSLSGGETLFGVRTGGDELDGLSLYRVKALEEAAEEQTSDDPTRTRAESALHLMRLGRQKVAESTIHALVDEEPEHAFANYAYALINLHAAEGAQSEAKRYQTLAQEAELRHESHWEQMRDDQLEEASTRKRRALRALAHAYTLWPSSESGGHRYYHDHQRRSWTLAQLIQLAFDQCHGQWGDICKYRHIQARLVGRPVKQFFYDDGVDALVLAATKEAETSYGLGMHLGYSSLKKNTMVLRLYLALSPEDYRRFLPAWLESLDKAPASEVARFMRHDLHHKGLWCNVIKQHLKTALSEEEIRARFVATRAKAHKEIEAKYNRIDDFIAGKKPYDDSDDF